MKVGYDGEKLCSDEDRDKGVGTRAAPCRERRAVLRPARGLRGGVVSAAGALLLRRVCARACAHDSGVRTHTTMYVCAFARARV